MSFNICRFRRWNKRIAGSEECSIDCKRQHCYPTPLVHTDMTKKTTFYEKRAITPVKCKVGLWLLFTLLPLINIYVYTKFNFNPCCTLQDIARTSNHYET